MAVEHCHAAFSGRTVRRFARINSKAQRRAPVPRGTTQLFVKATIALAVASLHLPADFPGWHRHLLPALDSAMTQIPLDSAAEWSPTRPVIPAAMHPFPSRGPLPARNVCAHVAPDLRQLPAWTSHMRS